MSGSPDDLISLFGPPPPGPSQDVRYRQGVIITFDGITLQNTVLVGGNELSDLPMLGVGEAALLVPGAVVAIMNFVAADGTATWAIIGRLVTPNTAGAAAAVSLRSSATYSATVDVFEDMSSVSSWGDLATIGPAIPNVLVGPSGRCLVYLTATIVLMTTAGLGEMGYQVNGATTVPPSELGRTVAHGGGAGDGLSATRVVLQEGLNPGLHTFTAKYLYEDGTGAARFSFRNLTVMTL